MGDFSAAVLADAFANVEAQNLRVARFSLNPADVERLRKDLRDAFSSYRGKVMFWNAEVLSDAGVPEGSVRVLPEDPRKGTVSSETVENYERVKRICASTWDLSSLPDLEKKPD